MQKHENNIYINIIDLFVRMKEESPSLIEFFNLIAIIYIYIYIYIYVDIQFSITIIKSKSIYCINLRLD